MNIMVSTVEDFANLLVMISKSLISVTQAVKQMTLHINLSDFIQEASTFTLSTNLIMELQETHIH